MGFLQTSPQFSNNKNQPSRMERMVCQLRKVHIHIVAAYGSRMLLSCCGARRMSSARTPSSLADRCHSLGSLLPPPAVLPSFPRFSLASPVKSVSTNKKSAIPVGMTDFLELLARFELATSSLPKVYFCKKGLKIRHKIRRIFRILNSLISPNFVAYHLLAYNLNR